MNESKEKDACEAYQILMMGFIDGELDAQQEARFKEHAYKCPRCAEDLIKYQKVAELTDSLVLKEPADYEWERIRSSIIYRMECRFGWFFVITGIVLIVSYLIYELCTEWDIGTWPRVGIVTALVGFILLMISTYRQRLRIKKYERYEAVKR